MPYCSKCGKEVPAGAQFCANCGTVLQVTAPSIPSQPSAGFVPPAPLGELGSRIVAGLVDYIIIGVIAGILSILFFIPVWVVTGPGMIGRGEVAMGWFSGMFGIIGVMWVLWLIYFTYFEGTSGQTIGKKLTHIKVIKEDGSRCDFGSALIRNILRIVDHLPFLYLLGIILIAATEKKQRLGDILAKTIVVKI